MNLPAQLHWILELAAQILALEAQPKVLLEQWARMWEEGVEEVPGHWE